MSEQYIIGEGVILDARPVSFISRTLGYLLDFVIYAGAFVAVLVILLRTHAVSGDYLAQVTIVLTLFCFVVAPTVIETLSNGRSVGKLATGTRVVRDDGGPIASRHAFIRSIVGFGEIILTMGAVAVVASLMNNRGKRVGDLVAGTYVVRVRSKKTKLEPLEIPTPLQPWIKNADIGKLPDGLALATRQFLQRRWTMSPAARATVGAQLQRDIAIRVHPQPPFDVHVEDYLVAVVAERAARESVVESRRLHHAESIQQQLEKTPYGIG